MAEKSSVEEPQSQSPSPTRNPQLHETQHQDVQPQVDFRSSLSRIEKWFIVGLIALAAFFSPFTANIYFPAIPTIAIAFKKPIELINLTVTVYAVLQGASPMFWGTLSDTLGRRPIAAACLLLLSLSCVGLGLVPTSTYWLLMVLRCIQAAGSSSTLAIGAGVISDISTPEERGGFYGVYSLGPMAGPALGPVIGGALTQALGWRAMFWFLCIAVSVCLLVLILFLPETLPQRQRTQSRLKILYKPVVSIIGRKVTSQPPGTQSQVIRSQKIQNPLLLFIRPTILWALIINATSFALFFAYVTPLSTLFEKTYPFLDELSVGLCFLSIGGAMAVGTGPIGKFMDWRYQVEKKRLQKRLEDAGELENRLKMEDVGEVDKLPEFPLEEARLGFLPAITVIMVACTAGYGWSLHYKANIAVPLILQALVGLICMAVMNGTTTLMIDLAPGQGSAVQACSNLLRCGLSAIIISIVQPIIDGIGVGWTYVLFAGLLLTSVPELYLVFKFGPRWRGAGGSINKPVRRNLAVEPSPSNTMSPADQADSVEGKAV